MSSAFAADYPNELDGLKLYAKYCSGLEPMRSTADDVKKVWGEPSKTTTSLLLWYKRDSWDILVYLFPDNGEIPSRLVGKVQSIDFISTEPTFFGKVSFPKAFNKFHVVAADAAWDEYYDAFGLAYEVYTGGGGGLGYLNRISYQAAPHKVIEMQHYMIQSLHDARKKSDSIETEKLVTVYSGYFVSNQFEPNAAESFVVIRDQEQFDKVFGVAMVMGDKSHRLPKDTFKENVVLAAVKRGKAAWEFKVKNVGFAGGIVELRYTATSKESESATFASPLIVSIPKGKYTRFEFVENGKVVKKIDVGKE
jgi:hypothetical protein